MNARQLRRLFLLSLPTLAVPGLVAACSAGAGTASTFEPDGGDSAAPQPTVNGGGNCPPFTVEVDGGLPELAADAAAPDPDAGDAANGAVADSGAVVVGPLSQAQCQLVCRGNAASCTVTSVGPPITVSCSPLCLGREPAGLVERTQPVTDLAGYLVEMARIEAASVHAFRVMARELARFSAPARLIARAERAARDERAHARMARACARRFGGKPRPPTIRPHTPRSLFEMAKENEVEGCVRETFGTLVGMYQARFAEDPAIRAMMRAIAADEARHAALSHQVSRWARTRLSSEERQALDGARAQALQGVKATGAAVERAPWQRTLGLPDARATDQLIDALMAETLPLDRAA